MTDELFTHPEIFKTGTAAKWMTTEGKDKTGIIRFVDRVKGIYIIADDEDGEMKAVWFCDVKADIPIKAIERLFNEDGTCTPVGAEVDRKIQKIILDLTKEYPNVDYHDLGSLLFQSSVTISRAILERRRKRGAW